MYCDSCGAAIKITDKFCTNCGKKIPPQRPTDQSEIGNRRDINDLKNDGRFKTKRFSIQKHEIEDLMCHLRAWLEDKNFNTQVLETEDDGILLQISKKGGWRKFVGMNTALNVVCYAHENNTIVKIGAGKWLDKALAGGVGMLLVWPFAITAGFGAYEQMKLPKQLFSHIESFERGL